MGVLLLTLASGGCRACSDSCDYLPPVLDGPYPHTGVRAGSAALVDHQSPSLEQNQADGVALEPLPVVTDP